MSDFGQGKETRKNNCKRRAETLIYRLHLEKGRNWNKQNPNRKKRSGRPGDEPEGEAHKILTELKGRGKRRISARDQFGCKTERGGTKLAMKPAELPSV